MNRYDEMNIYVKCGKCFNDNKKLMYFCNVLKNLKSVNLVKIFYCVLI